MLDRYRWLGVALSVFLGGHALAARYEPGPRHLARETTVHFDLYWNYLIVVQASAGGYTGLNFLVDTGASSTILSPTAARKLQLQEQPATLRVVGGNVSASQAVLSSVTLGPIEKQNLRIFVEDLSFLQKVIPVRVDGIIGLDVLGQTAFLIDYRLHSIYFGSLPALTGAIPLAIHDGLAVVQVALNGASANLLVDTGAGGLTMFARAARDVAERKVSTAPQSAMHIGEFASRQVMMSSLRVGLAEFGLQSLSIVPGQGSPDRAFDGLLSPAAMGVSRLAIDLTRGEIAFIR